MADKLQTIQLTAKEIRLIRDALFHALRTDGGDYRWTDQDRRTATNADRKLYTAIPKWQRPYHRRFTPSPYEARS